MYTIVFIILILVSILVVGVLANYAISRDKERVEERKSEYSRYRTIFGDDLRKLQSDEDKDRENREDAG